MAQPDSALVSVLLLTAGSLASLIIQLSNDTTPGTGNSSYQHYLPRPVRGSIDLAYLFCSAQGTEG